MMLEGGGGILTTSDSYKKNPYNLKLSFKEVLHYSMVFSFTQP